jgi:hypothetical protein
MLKKRGWTKYLSQWYRAVASKNFTWPTDFFKGKLITLLLIIGIGTIKVIVGGGKNIAFTLKKSYLKPSASLKTQ